MYKRCVTTTSDVTSTQNITSWGLTNVTPVGCMLVDNGSNVYCVYVGFGQEGSSNNLAAYRFINGELNLIVSGGAWKVPSGSDFCVKYIKD